MSQQIHQYRVGGASLNNTPLDWRGNTANIQEAIKQAKAIGIELLCLPELAITGYGCEDLFLHSWVYDSAWEELLNLVPHTTGISVAIGLPYLHDGKRYNGCALVVDGVLQSIKLKSFLPNEGVHYEYRWFEPWPAGTAISVSRSGYQFWIGDTTTEVTLGHKVQPIAFEICEDAWRTERPALAHAKKGIQTVLNPSASHFAFGKWKSRWNIAAEGSQIINGLYVYVNQLGNEAGRLIYDGDIIIAWKGQVICSAPRLQLGNVHLAWVELLNGHVTQASHTAKPSAEPEKELEFALASSLALWDYLRKARAKCYVLSLSGGADSSTCAALVSYMCQRIVAHFGSEKALAMLGQQAPESFPIGADITTQANALAGLLLKTAYQGTQNSSTSTQHAAQSLAESIGAWYTKWEVDDVVQQVEQTMTTAIGRSLTWEQDDIARQNVQARVRAPFIWMLTNLCGGLLLTTSNRSEGDVGYATMDGDTAGSLAPIAGVDKDFIRHWLRWAEVELGFTGLNAVNNLEPTAELRPLSRAQTDEKDLMPYPLLAAIERLAIFERRSPQVVYETLLATGSWEQEVLRTSVLRFYKLWSINQWKRERYAPSFHLDDFNIDPRSWCRFPILSGSFLAELEALQTRWLPATESELL